MINFSFFLKTTNFTLDVTFNLLDSSIIAIVGETGSGKTTLLKCISGLIKPEFGFLNIDGKILQDSRHNIFVCPSQRRIGHVLQSPLLFTHLTSLENILLGSREVDQYIAVKDLYKEFKFTEVIKKNIKNLSGGEKQRITIMQILLTQPKVILLDESFSSQDINIKYDLINFFITLNFKTKVPIIYVSHDINDIKKIADKVIYMHAGKIISIN